MYQVQRASHSKFLTLRHLRYHVRCWGEPDPARPPLVLLHGWMDVAASFQFLVDAFSESFFQGRFIIAPDWRGFGLSGANAQQLPHAQQDSYWQPDYLADLECVLDALAPGLAIDLVGHSMGGHIAMTYAGVRPQRIRRLINLEGFGMPATHPEQAPQRLAQWLDGLAQLRRGELDLQSHPNLDSVARRLMKTNPYLAPDKAQWLATQWACQDEQGRWRIMGDPAHKIPNAFLFRVDETLALYRAITAPTLEIRASENQMGKWWQESYSLAEFDQRLRHVAQLSQALIPDAGHMMHHDQPQLLASTLEQFLG